MPNCTDFSPSEDVVTQWNDTNTDIQSLVYNTLADPSIWQFEELIHTAVGQMIATDSQYATYNKYMHAMMFKPYSGTHSEWDNVLMTKHRRICIIRAIESLNGIAVKFPDILEVSGVGLTAAALERELMDLIMGGLVSGAIDSESQAVEVSGYIDLDVSEERRAAADALLAKWLGRISG
ncbi:hypothetical protein J8273_0533 [Carpediemonas membranifera]|uniref:Uncharacterized protein n=1 Tax=Carpediemonas membranifera TaxID=201153 RepID=A0A8J6E2Z9_9EUKA|nr:hypothetical protein J8273_0533 [Carpediemonas membranifera]|eukprot:KAG9395303.1 hypothetical protein J8273_0533 [Carpediemonas membranifera]